MTAEDLEGRVAIVTGAAMGIGRAVAERLAADSASVVLLDRERAELPEPTGTGRAMGIVADVSRATEVEAAIRDATDELGRVDILVNCAGIQRYGTVVDTTEEVWDEVMAVNLKSMFLTAKYCAPLMERAGEGAIVNVASVQAYAAQRGVAAYAASKAAVLALTRAMAVDFAPRIRVNAVCPGSVDTPMLRSAAELFADDPEEAIRSWGQMHPMGRVARPDEIADTVAYLAGPHSSFVTGASLVVDGGLLVRLPGT